MKVFVDANIYLGFIRLSQEKLDYLHSFLKLVKDKKFDLVFPKITQDEVFRNIPNVKNAYLIDFQKLLPQKPGLAVSISDKAKEISDLYKKYIQKIKELEKEYLDSVETLVQNILEPLSRQAIDLHENKKVLELAETRKKIGNPPGKGNHLGDEAVWELLLNGAIEDDLVIIVTNDSDWKDPSVKDKSIIHPYLEKEWKAKSKNNIKLFDTLSEFVRLQTGVKIDEKDIEKEREATKMVDNFVSFGSSASISNIYATTSPSYRGTITYWPHSIPTSTTTTTSTSAYTNLTICPNCHQQVNMSYQLGTATICPHCNFTFPY